MRLVPFTRSSISSRQLEDDTSALTGVALDGEAASVFGDNAVHKTQPQARALGLGGKVEVENALDIFWGYSSTRVGYLDLDVARFGEPRFDLDPSVRGRFDGVGE